MTRLASQRRSFARPAYAAAAGLAVVGVGLVQIGWDAVLDPRGAGGRPSAAALLLVASLYLLASGWFYLQGAVSAGEVRQPWWPRRLGLFCDGMLSGVVLAIMTRGHQSGVLGLGLWTVPPVLFAFSGVSGTVTFLTWNEVLGGPDGLIAPRGRGIGAYLRVAAAVLLIGILVVVEIGGRARAYIPPVTTN